MYFVDQIDLAVAFSELVFGVNEDKSVLGGDFLSAGEDLSRVVFHHGVIFCANNTLGDDFLL